MRSKHIKSGQVKTPDLAPGAATSAKVADGSLTGTDIGNGSLTGGDVAGNSLTGADIGNGSLTGGDVAGNSLTGGDIDESTFRTAPVGPAGGGLAGSFPNPLIGPDAVGGEQVAGNSLTGTDIDESSLAEVPSAATAQGVANGSVHPLSFTGFAQRAVEVTVPGGGTAENGNYDTARAVASCQPGEMAFNAGAFWKTTNDVVVGADDKELWLSSFRWETELARPNEVAVVGGNDTGTDHKLVVTLFCLVP